MRLKPTRKLNILFFLLSFLSFFCFSETRPERKSIILKGAFEPEVKVLRDQYLTKNREWLYNLLDEAEPYRIYVRNQIAKRKMPYILEYLPVVESNYLPTAKSKSGALGMWQFMLNSVEPFLICNEYVDERLDPWKSTEAALSKLQDNYRRFGDWHLAITAYNCGAGALERIIKKEGTKDYWTLLRRGALSEQASGYVPKLLAIAEACENCDYYGIKLPKARDANGNTIKMRSGSFDYISVKRSISLEELSHELRIDYEELKKLNLALIKGVTPPGKEYKIRLPEGMGKSAVYALKNIK